LGRRTGKAGIDPVHAELAIQRIAGRKNAPCPRSSDRGRARTGSVIGSPTWRRDALTFGEPGRADPAPTTSVLSLHHLACGVHRDARGVSRQRRTIGSTRHSTSKYKEGSGAVPVEVGDTLSLRDQKVNRSVAASLLAIALLLATATPGHAQHGRVFIWGPPYPYPYGYPPPYYAWAEEAERRAMAQTLLTSDPALLSGCARIGVASDDSVRDLRRKIVRAESNAALLSFDSDDLSKIQAEVFRCTATARAPSNIPPPPAGTPPPPPPPGPSR
jgi:hypothetical protein